MDKKYYSPRHSRLNRNYKKRSNNKPVNGTFLLRVNLCLRIAIIVIGCFEIKSDVSNRVADFVKNSVNTDLYAEFAGRFVKEEYKDSPTSPKEGLNSPPSGEPEGAYATG